MARRGNIAGGLLNRAQQTITLISGLLLLCTQFTVAQSTQTETAGEAPGYSFTILESRHDVLDTKRIDLGSVGEQKPLIFRVASNGEAAAGIAITPVVIAEPEGVHEHMRFDPQRGVTNDNGEFHVKVIAGDKPGRYEALFFQNPPPANGAAFQQFEFTVRDANWATMLVLSLLGGLAIFLYGMQVASDGLQRFAGHKLRQALTSLTKNQILGMICGVFITFFTQSSGATIAMLISFVRARLLSFRRSLGIMLGAAVGTSLTVQLISFNLFNYALPAIALGFVLFFLGKQQKRKSLGLSILGFGLIFFGMKIMSDQIAPLKGFAFFSNAIDALGRHPIWAVILSTIFTAAVYSSGATMAIVLSLARQDMLTLQDAIPFIFGAAIGTCFTGITASFGAPLEAKRIAWAHLVFKLAAVLVFLPFMPHLATAGEAVTKTIAMNPAMAQSDLVVRAIANTYTLFIGVAALIALPLTPLLEKLTRKIVPDVPEFLSDEMRTKYLELHPTVGASVALGSVRREISRMCRFVEEMMKQIMIALIDKNPEVLDFISQRDNKVDHLNREITAYLTDLSKRVKDEREARATMDLMYVVSDVESIGDIIDKNLVPAAKKMIVHDLQFSEAGREDLRLLHQMVSERLSQMVIALSTDHADLAEPIIHGFEKMQNEGKRLHMRHLQRLQDGLPESIETSSVHLDVINYLLRIDYLVFNICLHLAGKVPQPNVIEMN